MNENDLRHEIMLTIRANGQPVTGELWLTLIFMTLGQLLEVARELHIRTK